MVTPEGTVTFWLKHEHADWWSNDKGYSFGPMKMHGIELSATKHPDRTIDLNIAGPSNHKFTFSHDVPGCTPKGLMIALTWTPAEVRLYLNGDPIETRPIP